MARMNIDDSVFRDPRITGLAKELGWSRRETVGCLLEVWAICYDQGTSIIHPRAIDTQADHEGFAMKLVSHELAARHPSGRIVIRGAKDRVAYIERLRESARQGGLKSGETRRERSKHGLKHSSKHRFENPEASANPVSVSVSASSSASVSNSREREDRAHAREESPPPPGDFADGTEPGIAALRAKVDAAPNSARNAIAPPASDDELATVRGVLAKVSKHSGANLDGNRDHTRLIVERLRDGYTEHDLRIVVGYCALRLGWEDEEKMRPLLRPETLFADGKITKYVEPARAWYREIERQEAEAAARTNGYAFLDEEESS